MTRTTGRTGTVSSTVHCPVGLILRVLVTARPGTRCTQPHVGGASGRGSRLTRPGPAKPGPQAEQLSPAALPERCCRHRDHRKLQLLRLGNLSSDAPSAGLADGRPARRLGNVQVRPAAGPGPGAPPRPAGGTGFPPSRIIVVSRAVRPGRRSIRQQCASPQNLFRSVAFFPNLAE